MEIFKEYESDILQIVGSFVNQANEMKYLSTNERGKAIQSISLGINIVETFTHKYLFQTPHMFASEQEFAESVARMFLYALNYYIRMKKKN